MHIPREENYQWEMSQRRAPHARSVRDLDESFDRPCRTRRWLPHALPEAVEEYASFGQLRRQGQVTGPSPKIPFTRFGSGEPARCSGADSPVKRIRRESSERRKNTWCETEEPGHGGDWGKDRESPGRIKVEAVFGQPWRPRQPPKESSRIVGGPSSWGPPGRKLEVLAKRLLLRENLDGLLPFTKGLRPG